MNSLGRNQEENQALNPAYLRRTESMAYITALFEMTVKDLEVSNSNSDSRQVATAIYSSNHSQDISQDSKYQKPRKQLRVQEDLRSIGPTDIIESEATCKRFDCLVGAIIKHKYGLLISWILEGRYPPPSVLNQLQGLFANG